MHRYQRQIILKEFGSAGQQKLLNARVLVIGAGGLGCPVLQYLAAAGVGTLGIADDDRVDVTNLHRQVLYRMQDIGKSKAEQAALILAELNPEVALLPYCLRISNENALEILGGYDVVVDASDNFATRYLVNDACVLLGKPLVYGAIDRFEGQVAMFNVADEGGQTCVNYRDLFPFPPRPDEVPNCAAGGVLGVLPGIIGSLQAGEVIKLLTGIGRPLANRLLTYNLQTNESFTWDIAPGAETKNVLPKDAAAFRQMDYRWLCGEVGVVAEISPDRFTSLLQKKGILVIDVREKGEEPVIEEFPYLSLSLAQLEAQVPQLKEDTIITFCKTGMRSRKAAERLQQLFPAKNIQSLKGGILAWMEQQKNELHERT